MPGGFGSGVCAAKLISPCGRSSASWPSIARSIPIFRARKPCTPQPLPHNRIRSKRTVAHEYWFIDGRMMDFALQGHRWWSLIILDGYSRTMLAGAVAPAEASWVALTVLYMACQRYGVPVHLISDSGGGLPSHPPLVRAYPMWGLYPT